MRLEVCKGHSGLALYVDDVRVAGPRHNGVMTTVLSAEIKNGHTPSRIDREYTVSRIWRCFHCDEVFDDERAARMHFGRDEDSTPACKLNGSDDGLLAALRRAEQDAADAWLAIHNETTDAAKGFHAQATRHQEQLRLVEEVGYERGLRDARTTEQT